MMVRKSSGKENDMSNQRENVEKCGTRKPANRLKAERVQLAEVESRLKAERVQERLKRLPGWGLLKAGQGLDRVRQFGSAEAAADYAGFVLRTAAREKQTVRAEIQGTRLVLTVFGVSCSGVRGGISDNQLDFVALIG
jgi:hypothetical protein